MALERGPEGRLHVPAYRDGCYYNRMADSCLICLFRIGSSSSVSPVKQRLKDAQRVSGHDLIGEELVVPTVCEKGPDTAYEYVKGKVSAVHTLNGVTPDIVSVELQTGPTVHLDFSHVTASTS
ncbi:hypothetical protein [Natrononativus amylolyticus]|uniref:hypothetical protein n=1 Tax=Natrononativus amylolyticus TaxID=2963434 RepID=UPI0020CEFBDA|nr:hypothetical protein [Natrononativus amylolyticus]